MSDKQDAFEQAARRFTVDVESHVIGPCELIGRIGEHEMSLHLELHHRDTCVRCGELWPCKTNQLGAALAALDASPRPEVQPICQHCGVPLVLIVDSDDDEVCADCGLRNERPVAPEVQEEAEAREAVWIALYDGGCDYDAGCHVNDSFQDDWICDSCEAKADDLIDTYAAAVRGTAEARIAGLWRALPTETPDTPSTDAPHA